MAQQRPERFTLNQHHELAAGLEMAFLGESGGAKTFFDSIAGCHGAIDDCPWSTWLGRHTVTATGNYDEITLTNPALSFDQLTVSFWAELNSHSEFQCFWGGGTYPTNSCYLNNAATTIYWNQSGSTASQSTTAEAWQHIALRCDGTNIDVLVNGVPGSGVARAGPYSVRASALIGNSTTSVRPIAGHCADVLVHSIALSDERCKKNANPGNVMYDGFIVPNERKWWPIPAAAPGAFQAAWASNATQVAK